jgi:hypothetical protein
MDNIWWNWLYLAGFGCYVIRIIKETKNISSNPIVSSLEKLPFAIEISEDIIRNYFL